MAQSSSDSETIFIYSDGACTGNPGPGGYGVILEWRGKRRELSQGFRHTTNNRMELMAVIAGLSAIKPDNPFPVLVTTDSKYVADAVEKRWVFNWERKGFANKANADLWRQYLALHVQIKPRFKWVKGHAGHLYNERCDFLAVQAAQSPSARDAVFEAMQSHSLPKMVE